MKRFGSIHPDALRYQEEQTLLRLAERQLPRHSFLGELRFTLRGGRASAALNAGGDRPDQPSPRYYRFNRWDTTTRLCTRYEERPGMCRCYPYGSPCEHRCGCRNARPIALLARGPGLPAAPAGSAS